MPKFTRPDKTVYFAADKERLSYQAIPEQNIEYRNDIPVGLLNHNFATYSGPQRHRPEDSAAYRRSLVSRAARYGSFDWALLTEGVIWEMTLDDGSVVLYPLNGNGSNHWLERIFGPEFQRPQKVIPKTVSKRDAMKLFLRLQEMAKVTPVQKYVVETQYDSTSLAARYQRVVESLGFRITNATLDPYGIGRTPCEWIVRQFSVRNGDYQPGLDALLITLEHVVDMFPVVLKVEDNAKLTPEQRVQRKLDAKRTNAALLKALAIILCRDNEFTTVSRDEVLNYIEQQGAAKTVGESRGGGGEREVLTRLHEELGW
jgi:hypothetical protein